MKERRKCQDPLRFRQSSREDALQDDASHQPYESKRLPDAHEQLGAIVVRCRPGAGVLSVQTGCEGRAGQAGSQQQARIQFAKQQKRSYKRNGQQRKRAPDYGRPNLISFEAMDSQRLRNQDDGSSESKPKPEQQGCPAAPYSIARDKGAPPAGWGRASAARARTV